MVYVELGRQEIDREQQICGGSLIAPKWVITAAHCILAPEEVQWAAMNIVIYRHAKSGTGQGERIQAKRIIVNPDYEDGQEDSALIELERAPQNPRPIKVGGDGEEFAWAPGAMATVLGWGATSSGGDASDVLKEAQVPVVDDVPCGQAYSDPQWNWTAPVMICAGYPEGGTDTCQGDSGGPMLVYMPDGSPRLVGLTSFGEGCAEPGYPGVYAEAVGQPIRSWIAEHVPEAIAPPAPPPAAPPAAPAPAPAAPAPSGRPASSAGGRRPSSRSSRRAACRRKAKRLKAAKRKRAMRRCARLR
jgi:secreted trypsin-like serine protease